MERRIHHDCCTACVDFATCLLGNFVDTRQVDTAADICGVIYGNKVGGLFFVSVVEDNHRRIDVVVCRERNLVKVAFAVHCLAGPYAEVFFAACVIP